MQKENKKNNSAGFTLVETLIYIALFSIVIGGGMVAAYEIMQGTQAGNNQVILQEEANFIYRKINWALTGASSVNVTSNSLSLTKNINGTSTNLIFNYASPNLNVERPPEVADYLNSESISVTNLVFARVIEAGKPDKINVDFTLETEQGGRNYTQNFLYVKYLRK